MYTPIDALGTWMLDYMRERAECIEADACVHDHVNGACPYAPK
jgi:hypothetical protein